MLPEGVDQRVDKLFELLFDVLDHLVLVGDASAEPCLLSLLWLHPSLRVHKINLI